MKNRCRGTNGGATIHFQPWVATQQVVSRLGLRGVRMAGAHQFLCHDMVEAGTRLGLGRDMIFMSRRRQPLGCRDMAFGVATRKLLGS